MKKLLLTGFEPFLHYTENPTTEIVKYFHQRKVNDYHIKGKVLPVQFEEAGRLIITYIHEYNPDIIISLGIAKGRSKVTPERIAINCMMVIKIMRAINRWVKKFIRKAQMDCFRLYQIKFL